MRPGATQHGVIVDSDRSTQAVLSVWSKDDRAKSDPRAVQAALAQSGHMVCDAVCPSLSYVVPADLLGRPP